MHGPAGQGATQEPADPFDGHDAVQARLDGSDDQSILVVDDTPGNVVAIEAALLGLHRRLIVARSGTEALSRLLETDFTLILLDVQMPGMDGFETARLIRSRPRNQHVPIIFMTAYGRDELQVLEAYSLGAVDFLFKPIHPQVLKAKATFFVELQERTRELARFSLEQARQQWEAEALRQKSEDLAALNATLAEADRRKDEFLAMLAHELRNPLAPIHLALDVIGRRPALADDVERPLQTVRRQIAHLTRLVDDLLDVSRITAGKIELQCETISLSALIEHAVATSEPWFSAKQQQLQVEAGAEQAFVHGDMVRLTQVLSNLLNNAARYTPQRGLITLAFGRDGGQVFVRVSDTGRGISPELLARIFDMFVQACNEPGCGGLGLGLTLAKRLVELHGGAITAHSDGEDRGSMFEVRLPAVDQPVAANSAGAAQGRAQAAPSSLPLRVVVVDDNADIRETMTEFLELEGHQVSTAADGKSALELIVQTRPDVAFVDVGLPVMNGYDVARGVRQALGDARLRLVAMTGFGQDSDRNQALAAGFDVHLCKPASVEAIERVLAGARDAG